MVLEGGVHHIPVVGVSVELKLLSFLQVTQVRLNVLQQGDLGINFSLRLLLDLFKRLLLLLDQVHLEQVVLFKLLHVVHQIFLADANLLIIVAIVSVEVDVRVADVTKNKNQKGWVM